MSYSITNARYDVFSKDIVDLLDEYINDLSDDSWMLDDYFAKVINNNDPKKIGRCKVRVFNVLTEEIPESDLPWAIPDFGWIGSKVGNFVVPKKDTIVKVKFLNGDIYQPVYTVKGLQKDKLPDKRTENYPDNLLIYTTDDGEYYSVNRSTKKTTLHHSSGAEITIDSMGNVEINTRNVLNQLTGAKVTIDALNVIIKEGMAGPMAQFVGGNPTGPFNKLPIDPLTGLTHQGNMSINP